MSSVIFESTVTGEYVIYRAKCYFDSYAEYFIKVYTDDCELRDLECDNPLLLLIIFPLMLQGGDITIDGKITSSCYAQVKQFMQIWHEWRPAEFKPVNLAVNRIISDIYQPDNDKVVIAFSGGLDACYTLFNYVNSIDVYKKLSVYRAVMIHGADIAINENEEFNRAFHISQILTDSLSIKLIKVETNFRNLCPVNWQYAFGSIIASCLSVFRKKAFYGAASDYSINNFRIPWGMNPVTNQYLSNDSFVFITDAIVVNRTEKAAVLKNWPACIENLRCCWKNKDRAKNCGVCEKCVRTALNFKAVGVKKLGLMPRELKITDLFSKKVLKEIADREFYIEILNYAIKYRTLSNKWIISLKLYLILSSVYVKYRTLKRRILHRIRYIS